MNRIRGVRRNHHIAWANDREQQMRQRVFRADGYDRLSLSIELRAVLLCVTLDNCFPQSRYASRHGIPVIQRIPRLLDELLPAPLCRVALPVAHSSIEMICSPGAGLLSQVVDDRENIRRKFL